MEWKNISVFRIVLSMWLVGVCSVANAQELVPNGDFNYNDSCTAFSLPINTIDPWVKVYSSADFYHSCFPFTRSVPHSGGGGGVPYLGEGYAGVYTYRITDEKREFFTTELNEPLVEGVAYRGVFHISRMDSCWYATKSLGMFFSNSLPESSLGYFYDQNAQIENSSNSFLTDNDGWNRIDGSFVANGGERYLTIGSFKDDSETDTLFIEGGGAFRPNQPDYWSFSYYYIDGVSVIPDSIYLGIDDIENEEVFNLYPNPNTGEFTIDHTVDEKDKVELNVWSISGQLVARQLLGNGQSIIRLDVANGLYLYTLKVNGLPKWSGKTSVSSE
jgi:hypothetical protein